jgi:hypothetical protein
LSEHFFNDARIVLTVGVERNGRVGLSGNGVVEPGHEGVLVAGIMS